MKASALRFLVCPGCQSELGLRAESRMAAEVIEGALTCPGCGGEYPILRGVPRFVGAGAYAASFGRQWNWFRTVQLDSANGTRESERTLEATTGWTEADYRDRLVLDAGVGAGRFAEVVAGKGGEVVGVDLTSAVDAAYANVGRHERVHLVQGDIFALPFRPGTFDLAYSIGVLHHTPDPRAAFERVTAVVRPGGSVAVYLYAGYGPAHRFADAIRRITTRLPLGVMLALSALAAPLYYVYRIPLVGRVLRLLCPISMHPRWRWRWLDTFDWYTPRYQWKLLYPEVYRWFRSGGFADIEIFDQPIRMRGVKTRREAAVAPTIVSGGRPSARAVAPSRLAAPLNVVALGGGTGLPIVLQALKHALFPAEWRGTPARGRDRLTAIVAVSDDGGSSGRLRRAYRVLAPGDARNLMTEAGETEGYTAAEHVQAIRRHVPGLPVHAVLLNASPIPEDRLRLYAAEGAAPVPVDPEALAALGSRPFARDLLGAGPRVRHDPARLAAALLELAAEGAALDTRPPSFDLTA